MSGGRITIETGMCMDMVGTDAKVMDHAFKIAPVVVTLKVDGGGGKMNIKGHGELYCSQCNCARCSKCRMLRTWHSFH